MIHGMTQLTWPSWTPLRWNLCFSFAGNDGPGAGTVAKTGPWNAAVAASTHSRIYANTLDVTATGVSLTGIAAVPGEGITIGADINDTIKWAGDVALVMLMPVLPFRWLLHWVIGMAIREAVPSI